MIMDAEADFATAIGRLKLSKATVLLLHLAAQGHVWRNKDRQWVASTVHASRQVQNRISHLINKGLLSATYESEFPVVTELGRKFLEANPMKKVLSSRVIR